MGKTSLARGRSGILRVSSALGARVENSTGRLLGKVEDFVVDSLQGRVAYAILSLDDYFGCCGRLFAVPLPAISYRSADATFVLHADPETLKGAPGFDRNQWPNLGDRAWGEEIYSHYGYSPYWE